MQLFCFSFCLIFWKPNLCLCCNTCFVSAGLKIELNLLLGSSLCLPCLNHVGSANLRQIYVVCYASSDFGILWNFTMWRILIDWYLINFFCRLIISRYREDRCLRNSIIVKVIFSEESSFLDLLPTIVTSLLRCLSLLILSSSAQIFCPVLFVWPVRPLVVYGFSI